MLPSLKAWKSRFFNVREIRAALEVQQLLLATQQESYILQLLATPRYQEPKRLLRHENQVFSRSGTDGIVDEIFRRIGTTSKVFAEIGCGNGLENNTANLLWSGWKGFWFDGSDSNLAEVKRHFKTPLSDGRLKLSQAFFDAENAAGVLRDAGVPAEFDMFSLDIDRNTYHVWEALSVFRPRAWPSNIIQRYFPPVTGKWTTIPGRSGI